MHLERLVIASLIASGCHGEAHDSLPALQVDPLAAKLQAAHDRMHARLAAARRMEASIVRSDLDGARIEAHLLAELDEPDALPVWKPYLEDIRAAAHQIEISTGLGTAAKLTGTLGRNCARCHEAIKAHVSFPTEPRPPDSAKMMRHQWAAVQMWEGLIGPSDDRWLDGARALTTVPLTMIAMRATPTLDVDIDIDIDDVSRLRLYARRALAAQSQNARAEVFGNMLAICAHCHATLRDR
jgi:outer membrane murein-binding lipoprotein Lpp